MGSREIHLDGGEITILKALGVGSGEMVGEDLIARVGGDLEASELIDAIKGLMDMGYIDSDRAGFYSAEEAKSVHFRVNSGYSKDLREAIDPTPQKPRSKRVRRE